MFILCICLITSQVHGNMLKDDLHISVLDSVVTLTHDCQFDEALSRIEVCLNANPSSLELRLMRAVIFWHELLSYGFKEDIEASFTIEVNKLIADGNKIINKDANNIDALFYVGAAYGYLGQYHAAKQKLFPAAKFGKKGINYLNRVIKLRPAWSDAYLSLGVFHYYASNVPWFMKPILFILGQRGTEKKALEYLTIVSEKGHRARYAAQELLADLHVRLKEMDIADSLYLDLTKKFPHNVNYNYKEIELKFKNENYLDVVEIGAKVLTSIDSHPDRKGDLSKLMRIYWWVVKSYEQLKKPEKAIETYKLIIDKFEDGYYKSYYYLCRGYLFEKYKNNIEAIADFNWVLQNSRSITLKEDAQKHVNSLKKIDEQ